MEPHKRNTGITCEWKYPWNKKAACGNELTPREVDFCDRHADELDGMYLCYGHQKQLLEKKNLDKESGKDNAKKRTGK